MNIHLSRVGWMFNVVTHAMWRANEQSKLRQG